MNNAASPTTPDQAGRTRENELARAISFARWVGLILPLVVTTASTVLLLVWLPKMPDPAAVHWGVTGAPDGFGPASSYIWLNVLTGYGLTILMWTMIWMSIAKLSVRLWSPYQRFLAAFAAGFSVFMGLTNLASAGVQLGLSDAKDAPNISWMIGAAFLAWILVSVIAWMVQPRVDLRDQLSLPAAQLELSESERAIWIGEARPGRLYFWAMGIGLVCILIGAVAVFAVPTDAIARGIMAAAVLLVFVLSVMCSWFRVRIDQRGLEARSVVGWPTFRLPAEEIARVEATEINPFAEFGGWGMRWAPGRFGLVLRTGEGVVATRKDGRIFAITVDDSQRAASLLARVAKGKRK